MATAGGYSALDAEEGIESAPPEPAQSVEGSGKPAADGAGGDGSEGSEERAPLVEDVEAAGIERQAVQGKDQPKAIDCQDLEAESAADKARAAAGTDTRRRRAYGGCLSNDEYTRSQKAPRCYTVWNLDTISAT